MIYLLSMEHGWPKMSIYNGHDISRLVMFKKLQFFSYCEEMRVFDLVIILKQFHTLKLISHHCLTDSNYIC